MKLDILEISLTLLAISLTALFALITFYRQKEYELVLKRYLEGTLDLLAADLQQISAVFAHNWARTLAVIKSYRDTGDDFDVLEFSDGYLEMEASNPNIVAHYKLHRLTGTMDYWSYYQKAIAFYATANSILTKEIPETIKLRITGERINSPHREIAESAFEIAREKEEESHKYIRLISELQDLATSLESETFTFKKIDKFKNNKNVKSLILSLEEAYKSLEQEDSEANT